MGNETLKTQPLKKNLMLKLNDAWIQKGKQIYNKINFLKNHINCSGNFSTKKGKQKEKYKHCTHLKMCVGQFLYNSLIFEMGVHYIYSSQGRDLVRTRRILTKHPTLLVHNYSTPKTQSFSSKSVSNVLKKTTAFRVCRSCAAKSLLGTIFMEIS